MKRSRSEWNSLIVLPQSSRYSFTQVWIAEKMMFTPSHPPSLSFIHSFLSVCASLTAYLFISLFIECTHLVDYRCHHSRARFDVQKKNMAKRIDLETLARKIVSYIGGERSMEFRERDERRRYRFQLVHVPSRIQRDSTGKKKKEEGEKEGWEKRKIVIGGSDGSEARGKRMGFNIAGLDGARRR